MGLSNEDLQAEHDFASGQLERSAEQGNLEAQQRLREQEVQQTETASSTLLRAFRSLSPYADAAKLVRMELENEDDPNFNPEQIPEYDKFIKENIHPDQWNEFYSTQSAGEFEQRYEYYQQEREDKEILGSLGVGGRAAALAVGLVSPENLLPGAIAIRGGRAAMLAGKAGVSARALSIASGAVSGAAIATGTELAQQGMSVDQDVDPTYIPIIALAGFTIGGVSGAAVKLERTVDDVVDTWADPGFRPEGYNVKPRQSRPFLSRPTTEVPEELADSLSAGAAQNPRYAAVHAVKDTRQQDIIRDAIEYNDENLRTFEGTKAGEALYDVVSKLPGFKTTSDSLFNSGSEVGKMLAHRLLPNAAAKYRNNGSAAELGSLYEGHLLQPVTKNQGIYYKKYLNELGIKDSSMALEDFLTESLYHMQTMWHDGKDAADKMKVSAAVREFNEHREEANMRARRVLRGEADEMPVKGSEDLTDRPGWTTTRWNQRGIDSAYEAMGQIPFAQKERNLIDSLVDGYQQVHYGMSRDSMEVWAKAVLHRARSMATGVDTDLVQLLRREGTEFATQMLVNSGISEKKARKLIDELRILQEKDRVAKPLRKRVDIDLRTPIRGTTRTLMDLVDKDAARTWLYTSRTIGYQAGLARAGMSTDDLADALDALQVELDVLGKPRLNTKEIQYIKDMFHGRSLNTAVNPWVRRVTQLTNLAVLNGQAIPQIAESSNILAEFGFESFLKTAPKAVKDIFKRADNIDDLKEIAAWNSYIDGEEFIYQPHLMIDEIADPHSYALGYSSVKSWVDKLGDKVDGWIGQGQKLQSIITGHQAVKNTQHIIAARSFLRQIAEVAHGRKTFSDKRLFDMGIILEKDKALFERIKHNFVNIVEYDENGFISKMNYDKWDYKDFRDFNLILKRKVNQVVQKAEYGESSYLFNSDVGHLYSHLRKFTLLSSTKQTVRSLRMGDSEAVTQWIYGMMLAGMAYSAREALSGREPDLSPSALAKGALAMSPTTGSLAMALDPMGALLGLDGLKFNNFARPGVAGGTILPTPPALTSMERMAHLPESWASVAFGNYDAQDVNAIRSTPIIGNFLGMGHVFHAMSEEAKERKRQERESEKKANRKAEQADKPKQEKKTPKAEDKTDVEQKADMIIYSGEKPE